MAYHEVHNAVCHFGVVGSDVSDIIMLSYKYDCCDIIFLSYDMFSNCILYQWKWQNHMIRHIRVVKT